eukprot:12149959-Ditylum_brightwellii.AAC.1
MTAIMTDLAQHKAGLPLKYTPKKPAHGYGEGATCDLPGWNVNSDVILKLCSKEANGSKIKDPTEEIT